MNKIIYWLVAIGVVFASCETNYDPDTSKFPIEYVVEGFIEYSSEETPTYVFISKTIPFYDRIDEQVLAESFVRDAEVTVTRDGAEAVVLTEVCLDAIDPAIANLIRDQLVVNNVFSNFCIYLDVFNEIEKIPGSKYELVIISDDDRLVAKTTIPDAVSPNRLFHAEPPGNVDTTFFEFGIELSDPLNDVNFYRALAGVNSLPYYSNNASVFDDVLIEGKTFSFPIARPIYPGDDVAIDTVGLFRAGDTVHLKWMTIDADHYEFWASLEFDTNNGGPFASYTRANSNVDGALGVWGGLSAFYYDYIIPK